MPDTDDDRPGCWTRLPERVTDRLTDCPDCPHYANEHASEGCLGTVDETEENDFSDQCPCMFSPPTIQVRALETAVAEARREALEEACRVIRGEGEDGNPGESIQVNYAQELIRDLIGADDE